MLKKIHVCISEFWRFFYCSRIWGFFLVIYFFTYIYLKPVKDCSKLIQYPVAPWVSAFLFSDLYYGLLFLLGAVYIFSKVPFCERWQMYLLIRCGKERWILIQVIKIILCAFCYVLLTVLVNIIVLGKDIEYTNNWGKFLYTLALTNVAEAEQLRFGISYDLMVSFKPIPLLIITVVIAALIVSFIGVLMFYISLYFSRFIAVIIATILAIFPIIIENAGRNLQKIMVEIIPTEWIKIEKLGNYNFERVLSPNFETVIIRLLLIIGVLVALIMGGVKKIQFNWYGEE